MPIKRYKNKETTNCCLYPILYKGILSMYNQVKELLALKYCYSSISVFKSLFSQPLYIFYLTHIREKGFEAEQQQQTSLITIIAVNPQRILFVCKKRACPTIRESSFSS
jgi:hypothetical protein